MKTCGALKPYTASWMRETYVELKRQSLADKGLQEVASQKPTSLTEVMGIRLPSLILNAKHICKLHTRNQSDVPKGHMAVYVGEIQKKRFVVPISYLNHPSFRELLLQAEEEFGFNHPMGGLTIPCREDAFIGLTAQLNCS
ncbi:hypothetical protein LguiA_027605 [Lonicera macranthoides]